MSNLAVINKIENLTAEKKYFVSLRVGNKSIKDIEKNVLKRECADIISKAYFDAGYKLGDNTQEAQKALSFQTEALFNELTGVFTNLTIPELKEAFRRGVRNESGQWMGLCGKTYHQFIKWFYNLQERQKAWVEYLDLIETPPKLVIDKMMFSKEGIEKTFNDYKISGRRPFAAFAYYDILNELKGVEYKGFKTLITDPELRNDIISKVKAELTEKLVHENNKATRRGDFGVADGIMSVIASEFKGDKIFENALKERYLMAYFDKLIIEGKEIDL